MTVEELLQANLLDEAVERLTAEVRDNPMDHRRRTFLFELLCFAGQYARAEKQLDVLGESGPQAEMGAILYRGALSAERTRQDMFEKESYPRPSPDSRKGAPKGTINAKSFSTLTDTDPRIGAQLEVFAAGTYLWIPFVMIDSVKMEAPKRLRDLLWRTAVVRTSEAFQGRELGEVFLPALSPGSWKDSNAQVRLGRVTNWEQDADGRSIPIGQKILMADEEEWPILEVLELQFQIAKAAP
jgi:type VI secretion system protein ImpE